MLVRRTERRSRYELSALFTCVAVGLIAERRTVFDRRLGNFESRFEEISATVESRSHGPISARCMQLAKVEVADKNGFLVRIRFSGDTIASELEVRWSQHSGLAILDIHVENIGKVANVSRPRTNPTARWFCRVISRP